MHTFVVYPTCTAQTNRASVGGSEKIMFQPTRTSPCSGSSGVFFLLHQWVEHHAGGIVAGFRASAYAEYGVLNQPICMDIGKYIVTVIALQLYSTTCCTPQYAAICKSYDIWR